MKAKQKSHKLLSLLLCCAVLIGMMPMAVGTAFAADTAVIKIENNNTDNCNGSGWSYVKSTRTLTLNGYSGGLIYVGVTDKFNLVLEGSNTITGSRIDTDSTNASYYGICCNNVDLKISGSGSLTINATGNSGTQPTYGIYANGVTMSGGTVEINADATNQVYGVWTKNSKLDITGGKLTANITGTSDGFGLYCPGGTINVGSSAEVNVDIKNNGSAQMYGIYNAAGNTSGGIGNGDIKLAGTVKVTRNTGSTGTGYVQGIVSGGNSSNTAGVISVTGGEVTVQNANYGIAAYTKGHGSAFDDVRISGGTVNITSDLSGSNGIVSYNNGVIISGGSVSASTGSAALLLSDNDEKQAGLVTIKNNAVVSLTSTGYSSKVLMVTGDRSNSSTRIHQIDLTSGGKVTIKSKSTDNTTSSLPVRGYFSLGSNTECTKDRLSDHPSQINAGGGKMFVSDDSTKQVVVEYQVPTTHPAKPTINVTGTYTYTGSDITATVTGYDSATMNITGNVGNNAGNYTVSVTSKTGKWADGSTDAVTKAWSIAKADPTVTAPTGLTGTKGKALSTVTLTSGWAWKAPTTVMNTTGNQTFTAVYTPTDTTNYNTKEENLTVNVTEPAPTDPAKPTINVTGTYTYTGSDITATVTGYDSATMNITGNTGKIAGNYTVSVTSKTGKWADGSTDAVTKAWSIAKANPTVTAPTGLTGTKGKALSTVTLPTGWAWKAPATVMNTTGNQTFTAVYTPADTTNYNTKEENLTVNVTVASSGGSGGGGGGFVVIPVETPAEKFVKDNLSANGAVIKTVDKNNYEQILAAADKYDKLSASDKAAVDKLLKEKAGMDMATFTAEASKVKASVAEPSSNTDKVKSLVKGLSIKASSAKLKSKSIRVTLSGSTSSLAEIKKLGYTVKYKFYRSTKKTSSYKAMITKNEAKYVNSTGKKGTMYYYKARVMVYDTAGKLVAQSELKQCKYANRKWTK